MQTALDIYFPFGSASITSKTLIKPHSQQPPIRNNPFPLGILIRAADSSWWLEYLPKMPHFKASWRHRFQPVTALPHSMQPEVVTGLQLPAPGRAWGYQGSEPWVPPAAARTSPNTKGRAEVCKVGQLELCTRKQFGRQDETQWEAQHWKYNWLPLPIPQTRLSNERVLILLYWIEKVLDRRKLRAVPISETLVHGTVFDMDVKQETKSNRRYFGLV